MPWLETEYYDYDQDKDMVEKYEIGRDIPVFVFLDKQGSEFERMKGEIDRNDLVEFLKKNKDK